MWQGSEADRLRRNRQGCGASHSTGDGTCSGPGPVDMDQRSRPVASAQSSRALMLSALLLATARGQIVEGGPWTHTPRGVPAVPLAGAP